MGATLALAGIAGLLTVADDLRHVGELVGVLSIFLAGIVLLVAARSAAAMKFAVLPWIAVGIAAGMLLGAAIDHMLFSVGLGTIVGAVVARWRRLVTKNDPR